MSSFGAMSAFAEFERALIKERQIEGLPWPLQDVFDVTFNHEWNIREAALNAWDSNSGQNIATFTSSHDHSLCPMEFLTFSRVAFDPTSSEALSLG